MMDVVILSCSGWMEFQRMDTGAEETLRTEATVEIAKG